MIRILTIDDHPLLREGINALVSAQPDMRVIAEAADGNSGLEAYRRHTPDVCIVDLRLPDIDGVTVIERIRVDSPGARCIVLTSSVGDVEIQRALRAGARAYLLKDMVRHELLDTIRLVHAGRTRVPSVVAEQIAEHLGTGTLTARETEVLARAAQGRKNKQIADELGISEETVKVHTRNILSKLGADDRTHAVTIALRRGILHL